MTEYGFGPYTDVIYVQWNDEAETDQMRIYRASFNPNSYEVVYRVDPWPYWQDMFDEVANGMQVRPYKPSEYHVWDEVNQEWVVDQLLFTPVLKEELKAYRDSKATEEVTFNGVTANNTVEERNLIVGIIVYLQAKGEEQSLAWKQPNDSFVLATISDFQGLMLVGGQLTQDAFASEAHVLAQHELVPYASLQDAFDAFDTFYNGLQ